MQTTPTDFQHECGTAPVSPAAARPGGMEWEAAVGDTNFGFHLGVCPANATAIVEIKTPKHTRE